MLFIPFDAPSRKNPTLREWQHWLVVNIPRRNVDKGEVSSEYLASCPPKDTGLYRYIVLVSKQPSKLSFNGKRLSDKSAEGCGRYKSLSSLKLQVISTKLNMTIMCQNFVLN